MSDMASQFPPEPPAGLLGRVRAGDDAAFEELYRLYASRAYTLALRMLDQREAAEEVLQEVFMDLTRALPGYRGDGPFWGWLRRMVVTKVLMRLRSERARPSLVAVDGQWLDQLGGAMADHSHGVLQARELQAALAMLPAVSRAVVWLYDVEGWTHQEIADAMGRTVSFSKSQLARAHQRLRELLTEESEDASGHPTAIGAT